MKVVQSRSWHYRLNNSNSSNKRTDQSITRPSWREDSNIMPTRQNLNNYRRNYQMNPLKNITKAYVSEAARSYIIVNVIDESLIELLLELGFAHAQDQDNEQNRLSLITPDQRFKAKIFEKLRDEGICFSAGPGWCPAEIFELLRDNKMLNGSYRKILWHGPGKPEVIENC